MKMNPADDPSRGLPAEAIIASTRWTKGTEFLWRSEERWPQMATAIEEGIKQKPLEEVTTTLAIRSCPPDYNVVEVFKQFSSWYLLKRSVAWILRYRNRLRIAVTKRKKEDLLQSYHDQKIDPLREKSSRSSKVAASATSCCLYIALLRRPQTPRR